MPSSSTRELLDRLSVSPVRLRVLLARLKENELRTPPPVGGFAPIEDAWHLRDLEAEGHFPRIRRILAEDIPLLVPIDGDELAVQRHYLERELGTALDEFAQFREATLGLLGELSEDQWSRRATFEGRSITLRDLVSTMAAHDESHLNALAAELQQAAGGVDSHAIGTAPEALGAAGSLSA
ncbi:MAG TPA: DinB family protein [Steroidobacteraceae bacterium]